MSKEENNVELNLEWVNLQKELTVSHEAQRESSQAKFSRKVKENPLIPLGCLTTAVVLCFGLYSFSKGNRELSQKMMRFRVLAQGMTIGALMISLFTASVKK